MAQINQPSNKIALTNVSVVRYRKAGKRFEIACYSNSVQSYRNGTQKDMSEVLQIEQVFLNVSKGQTAKAADLEKAFGTTDISEVVKMILDKGELQVGGKEREQNLESMKKEIATGIAEKCVDPNTQRPHTVSMIEKALNEAHFNVLPSKSVKSQVLEAIKLLQEAKTIPIQRARMRIRLTMPAKDGKRIKDKVIPSIEKVEEEDWSEEWEIIGLIDPGQFKVINELLQSELKGKGRLETLSFAAVEGEERIE